MLPLGGREMSSRLAEHLPRIALSNALAGRPAPAPSGLVLGNTRFKKPVIDKTDLA